MRYLILLLALMLAACGGSPDPTPTPTATPLPVPTETPTPPAFERYHMGVVVAHFQSSGVEFGNPQPMTRDDYGAAPMTATSGTRFLIPSLCATCGGRLFTFATAEDLELTRDYYVELGRSSALFYSHVFVYANVLVQINGELPDDQAARYEAILQTLP